MEYDLIDFRGIAIGILAFVFVLFIGLWLLKKHHLNTRAIFYIALLACLGHFIGAFFYYYYSIKIGSDSVMYFQHAYANDGLFGYSFAISILEVLRKYIVDNSLLGAFFIFGSIGFLGSIYYALTLKILLDRIAGLETRYLLNIGQLNWPMTLLMCWPSYLFWSSGLVKDSFSFTSIAIILYTLVNPQLKISNIIIFFVACTLGFFVRPYLFLIFITTAFIYLLLNSKQSLFVKIIMTLLLIYISSVLLPLVLHFSGISQLSTSAAAKYAIRQQAYMSIGTSISVPTHNPKLLILFLPYLIIANLFLPLFIKAHNFIAIVSSIENTYLVWLVTNFIRNKIIWNELTQKIRILKFLLLYFLVGISFLGLISTNLGLAMREKIMYVPALLMIIMLVTSYKKVLMIKSYLSNELGDPSTCAA